jgi:hypothetical protein
MSVDFAALHEAELDGRHGHLDAPVDPLPLRMVLTIEDSPIGPVMVSKIRPMAETTKQRKTDDDKTEQKEGTSTSSTSTTDEPTVTQTPPARTFAGSGTADPVDLNPVTHGEYRRDVHADI